MTVVTLASGLWYAPRQRQGSVQHGAVGRVQTPGTRTHSERSGPTRNRRDGS